MATNRNSEGPAMPSIETKFSVGDRVFVAGIRTSARHHECPDCMGSKKWRAVSPAGTEYDFPCPRCSAQFTSLHDMSLDYSVFEACVSQLTIGSVRIDTNSDKQNSYMCRETGVGSGSVYNEDDLFHTHDEAMAEATRKALENTTKTNWMAKKYNKSLYISDYQLDNAVLKLARDTKYKHQSRIETMFDQLRDCETIGELHEYLDQGLPEPPEEGE